MYTFSGGIKWDIGLIRVKCFSDLFSKCCKILENVEAKGNTGAIWVNSFMMEYRNQSNDLQNKSMGWFPYDKGLGHERVKRNHVNMISQSNQVIVTK